MIGTQMRWLMELICTDILRYDANHLIFITIGPAHIGRQGRDTLYLTLPYVCIVNY